MWHSLSKDGAHRMPSISLRDAFCLYIFFRLRGIFESFQQHTLLQIAVPVSTRPYSSHIMSPNCLQLRLHVTFNCFRLKCVFFSSPFLHVRKPAQWGKSLAMVSSAYFVLIMSSRWPHSQFLKAPAGASFLLFIVVCVYTPFFHYIFCAFGKISVAATE